MLRKLATAVGYAKAPKTTLLLRHPVKGTQALAAAKGTKELITSRAGMAIGAIAAAVPVAVMVAKRRKKED